MLRFLNLYTLSLVRSVCAYFNQLRYILSVALVVIIDRYALSEIQSCLFIYATCPANILVAIDSTEYIKPRSVYPAHLCNYLPHLCGQDVCLALKLIKLSTEYHHAPYLCDWVFLGSIHLLFSRSLCVYDMQRCWIFVYICGKIIATPIFSSIFFCCN